MIRPQFEASTRSILERKSVRRCDLVEKDVSQTSKERKRRLFQVTHQEPLKGGLQGKNLKSSFRGIKGGIEIPEGGRKGKSRNQIRLKKTGAKKGIGECVSKRLQPSKREKSSRNRVEASAKRPQKKRRKKGKGVRD